MKLYTYDSGELKFKPISTPKIGFLILISFLFLGVSTTEPKVEYITNTQTFALQNPSDTFSEERLVEKIKELNFRFPHIVLAQAKLESGEFTSNIFRENYNMFGMREARVRLNLAKGTQFNHAYYNNWEESLMDYALWYSSYARECRTEKQLYTLLDKQYAEANHYVTSLKNIIEKQNLKEVFNAR